MVIFGAIAKLITGPIETLLETRKIKKSAQAEVLVELAKAEAREKVAIVEARIVRATAEGKIAMKKVDAEVDWEKIWSQQSSTSLKDEWFVGVLSIPLIGAFIPFLTPYIQTGFEVLSTTPDWYKAAIMAAISASFGLRGLSKFTGWKKKNKENT